MEKDHGRIETRHIRVSDEIDWLTHKPDWPGLRALVMMESQHEFNGQFSYERRCFITSHAADPKRIGRYIRHHWRVENSLHQVLDVVLNEDQSRTRVGHAAENLAIIRRFAPNLLRQARGSRPRIKNKRLRAAYDDSRLSPEFAISGKRSSADWRRAVEGYHRPGPAPGMIR